MIKLFLITLLCATLVFADLPDQRVQDLKAWKGPVNGFFSTMEHSSSSLVRRSANGRGPPERPLGRGPPGRPPGRPPGGENGGSEGVSEAPSGGEETENN